METNRFDIFLISLDPTQGSEIKKTRPCVIVSPDEMNRNIRTVIIAPLTSKTKEYPTRVKCKFKGKNGELVLDQIRTVDKGRLLKKMGILSTIYHAKVFDVLQEMFAE